MRVTIFILAILFSLKSHAERLLFSDEETKALNRLKRSKDFLLKNQQRIFINQGADLFHGHLLIISKFEALRQKEAGPLKELEKFDENWLRGRLLDKQMKQLWQRRKN